MRTCVFLTFLAGILHAQGGAQERRICTERTIQGSYGYTFIGARPASPMPGAPIVEGRGVGIRIFDGQGNFTQVDSVKGVNTPALIDQPASGTYKINPDCTGTAFLTVPGMPGAAEDDPQLRTGARKNCTIDDAALPWACPPPAPAPNCFAGGGEKCELM